MSPLGYVSGLPDYDITQYSVSYTISRTPGPNEVYKTSEQIINELINFSNSNMLYLNGTKVVSSLSHQQDFRTNETSDIINQTKWNVYTKVLLDARKDPRIRILLPQEVYNLRHPSGVCGNNLTEVGEECDDGNLINGDGCSAECKIEGFFSVKVCDWQNCNAAAASVSMDDSEPSCRDKLNANGFKGTYFLMDTDGFNNPDWNLWNSIYSEGHELGTHTQSHTCNSVSESQFILELSTNKQDILDNINHYSKSIKLI